MKVSLKGLLDEPRGSAWPPSARAVTCKTLSEACSRLRCPAKPGNELDLHLQLLTTYVEHIVGTALETRRKLQATVGLYAPNPLGYTRATMVRTMGCYSERRG